MEQAARLERMNQLRKSKGIEKVKEALAKFKGVSEADLFAKMYQNGEGMTFDLEGAPMIYKRIQQFDQMANQVNPFSKVVVAPTDE